MHYIFTSDVYFFFFSHCDEASLLEECTDHIHVIIHIHTCRLTRDGLKYMQINITLKNIFCVGIFFFFSKDRN